MSSTLPSPLGPDSTLRRRPRPGAPAQQVNSVAGAPAAATGAGTECDKEQGKQAERPAIQCARKRVGSSGHGSSNYYDARLAAQARMQSVAYKPHEQPACS
jgi:hypothetical protein